MDNQDKMIEARIEGDPKWQNSPAETRKRVSIHSMYLIKHLHCTVGNGYVMPAPSETLTSWRARGISVSHHGFRIIFRADRPKKKKFAFSRNYANGCSALLERLTAGFPRHVICHGWWCCAHCNCYIQCIKAKFCTLKGTMYGQILVNLK